MFDDFEQSEQDGSPVELYRFTHGVRVWTYTSGDESFVYNGEKYEPVPMQRSAPMQSNDRARSGVDVSLDGDTEIAALYATFVPPQPVALTIFVVHRGDDEIVDFWTGRVRSCRWGDHGAEATLHCEPNTAQLQRWGLRQLFQASCNVALFSTRCGVPSSAFKIAQTVGDCVIDGNTISSSLFDAFADGWLTGGYVERPDSLGDARMILSHVGDTIVLLAPFEGLTSAERLFAYAGCDHTFATCSGEKFAAFTDDGESFCGCPTIPTRNIYESGVK